MASRETENNAYAKFGVTKKEHYGMLWYFLEWSIANSKRLLRRLLGPIHTTALSKVCVFVFIEKTSMNSHPHCRFAAF